MDPFFGTGTTGAIAKCLGRHYIGIEKKEKYIQAATKRIQNVQLELDTYSENLLDVKPPKVSLKELIVSGYLKKGQCLFNRDKSQEVILNSDGHATFEGEKDSIHRILAKLLNRANNNGWDYFYCFYDGEFVGIDSLRYLANEKRNK